MDIIIATQRLLTKKLTELLYRTIRRNESHPKKNFKRKPHKLKWNASYDKMLDKMKWNDEASDDIHCFEGRADVTEYAL